VRRIVLALAALSVSAAACSGGGPFPADAFIVSGNTDLAVGTERIAVAVRGPTGERLSDPDVGMTLRAWPEGREDLAVSAPAHFTWAIPDVSGMYLGWLTFDRPGVWEIEATPDGADPLPLLPVSVGEEASTPAPGDPAPPSQTVTAADAPLAEITTDTDPDPRFYELSIAEAVTSGRPSVIAFATPRFCTSQVCGPMMDILRAAAPAFPDVNWVHVEVYSNLDDPANLEVVPAVEEWGLPTEPWVFVVDADGVVTDRFEGVVTAAEITAALGR
jgi:hypothetical protein